jgi:hypothetical protein
MASSAVSAQQAFDKRTEEVRCPSNEINALVLDYLTNAGYAEAAAKFCKEANIQPLQEDEAIRLRRSVTDMVHQGNIEAAIAALNDLDPEILDRDPSLHFSLLRLQLVELIRDCTTSPGGDIIPALNFARSHLAPRASSSAAFLELLEETMALLVFPHDSLEPKLAAILDPNLRRVVADDVNKAVLDRQARRSEAAILRLVKVRAWAENTMRDSGVAMPENMDLGLNEEENNNGNSPVTVF